jgi:CBS domain-containing protein
MNSVHVEKKRVGLKPAKVNCKNESRMLVKDLISDEIPFATLNDSCQTVSQWLDEFKMTHLPVVNDAGLFAGIITEMALYEIDDWDDKLLKHQSVLEQYAAAANDHAFDALLKMANSGASCLAAVDEKGVFVGSISIYRLVKAIGNLSLVSDKGGIIQLEMNIIDYSLTEIARIVESNNARILGTYITANPDNRKITVTLKLNKRDVTSILKTFERYEYTVTGSYQIDESNDGIQDRFDNLMNYLNI